ncbi:hypothetical protein CC1G_01922 [Coprinopsis cinerea okayama7|uniref:Uncharacterized protein n=1 Tax=Coprinopsis cinerea (strain Okayama-7 / 130 / ATCC MYA-4618 / FGSC 9003) TaxID=240176 RepID=A8N5Z1_COPC7|nr:hypothetical protein CC1G_01922 [Coprinopsis cinerea okayama7\|eukprot:XP_001830286.2 hypothetical protein CC1G_01922 [Coprinopsis cinerea okayama7\
MSLFDDDILPNPFAHDAPDPRAFSPAPDGNSHSTLWPDREQIEGPPATSGSKRRPSFGGIVHVHDQDYDICKDDSTNGTESPKPYRYIGALYTPGESSKSRGVSPMISNLSGNSLRDAFINFPKPPSPLRDVSSLLHPRDEELIFPDDLDDLRSLKLPPLNGKHWLASATTGRDGHGTPIRDAKPQAVYEHNRRLWNRIDPERPPERPRLLVDSLEKIPQHIGTGPPTTEVSEKPRERPPVPRLPPLRSPSLPPPLSIPPVAPSSLPTQSPARPPQAKPSIPSHHLPHPLKASSSGRSTDDRLPLPGTSFRPTLRVNQVSAWSDPRSKVLLPEPATYRPPPPPEPPLVRTQPYPLSVSPPTRLPPNHTPTVASSSSHPITEQPRELPKPQQKTELAPIRTQTTSRTKRQIQKSPSKEAFLAAASIKTSKSTSKQRVLSAEKEGGNSDHEDEDYEPAKATTATASKTSMSRSSSEAKDSGTKKRYPCPVEGRMMFSVT